MLLVTVKMKLIVISLLNDKSLIIKGLYLDILSSIILFIYIFLIALNIIMGAEKYL